MTTQNLNECLCGKPFGTKFWKGRAFWGKRHEHHFEWAFGRFARSCHLKLNTRAGDDDNGILLMVGLPFLFDFYLAIGGVFKYQKGQQERDWGVAIHNQSFWIYPGNWANESNSRDPWWLRCHAWHFPWTYDWHSTEILEHKANVPGTKTVYLEQRGRGRKRSLDRFSERQAAEKTVQKTYDYHYTLNSGEVQHRRATVHVDRLTWRMRWWPLLPFAKVRTSIDISFDAEVGERTGSWKGGCTGCSYDMNEGETPLECLRRMESERRFNRR